MHFSNALDRLDRSLALIEDEAEYKRLYNEIDRLEGKDPNLIRCLACLIFFPEDRAQGEAADDNHICHSLDRLLTLLRNEKNELQPYTREEIVLAFDTLDSLKDESVRERTMYTLYRLFDGTYPDVALAIVEQLEMLTDGQILFGELSAEDSLLYSKVYVLTLSLYSVIMPTDRLDFMLRDYLCLLLVLMDVELIPVLTDHIRTTYALVENRRQASLDFAAAIGMNPLDLGKDVVGRTQAVKDWIKKAGDEIGKVAVPEKSLDVVMAWLTKSSDVLANDVYAQSLISHLVLAYVALISGYAILEYHGEDEFESLVTALEKEEAMPPLKPPARTTEEQLLPVTSQQSFPEMLLDHRLDFFDWISEQKIYEIMKEWLKGIGGKAMAWEALADILREVVPKELTQEQVAILLGLDNHLKEDGYSKTPDLVFYNEERDKFELA